MLVDLIRVPEPTCIDDMLDEPFGLLMLAACLREANIDVRITNLAGHDYTSWIPCIEKADIYGIQLNTPTAPLGVAIAIEIMDKYPDSVIVCGGAHTGAVDTFCGLEVFDHIVVGEGERVLPEIVEQYKKGVPPPRVIHAEPIENLDSLPFPARDMVDMFSFHRKVDGERCFGIIGTRGCCFKCAFCDRTQFGDRVRYRSVGNVVKEIEHIIDVYGVKKYEFFDDMFTYDKSRLMSFCDMVDGMGLNYRCNGRADVLNGEIYERLARSGCSMICFGIESGSQFLLNRMRKGTKVTTNYKAIKMAQEAGMRVAGYFVVGFPGETKETIEQTKEFIVKSGIDHAQIYTFIPLPGNEVYRNPEKFGVRILSHDYSDYYLVTGTDGHGGMTMETDFLSAEELRDEVAKFRVFLKEYGSRGAVQDYYRGRLEYKDR